MSARDVELDRLWDVCAELGDHELSVVLSQAERLLLGQRQYGRLNVADGRDWLFEALQEVSDLNNYLHFALKLRRLLAAASATDEAA